MYETIRLLVNVIATNITKLFYYIQTTPSCPNYAELVLVTIVGTTP